MSPLLPDLIVPLRGGPNEELRTAIRSWHANLRFGRIVVAGGRPDWLTGVTHLPVEQQPNQSHRNALDNLRALLDFDLAEDVIVCNDDFFVTEMLIREIPALHRGPLADIETCALTLELLRDAGVADPLCYELHVPAQLNTAQLRQTVAWIDERTHGWPVHRRARIHWRTVHGNLHRLGGQEWHDVKVHDLEPGDWPPPFVSTNDETFAEGAIGRHVRALFPDPSPYES